jgi:hypothetical protein
VRHRLRGRDAELRQGLCSPDAGLASAAGSAVANDPVLLTGPAGAGHSACEHRPQIQASHWGPAHAGPRTA